MPSESWKGECIFLFCVAFALLLLCAYNGWQGHNIGYRRGQIDAANGVQLYASIETDAGTRWYRKDKPGKLFERRTPE